MNPLTESLTARVPQAAGFSITGTERAGAEPVSLGGDATPLSEQPRGHTATPGAARVLKQHCPPVLDACCGSRMFWFQRADPRAVYVDNRRESHTLADSSSTGGSRELVIDPDIFADFTALPFEDGTFALVVFDPPHFTRNGEGGWMAKKYGKLTGDWREMLRKGFAECFRVLRHEGTLIFKWNENEIPVSEILKLTPERPLFGHKSGKNSQTHWIAFLKHNTSPDTASPHSQVNDQAGRVE